MTRENERLGWARRVLAMPTLELERASTDAGFRSYWRTVGIEPARIIMDSPPDKEDVRPWLAMRDVLERGGVHFTGDAPRAALFAFWADPDKAGRAGYLVAL